MWATVSINFGVIYTTLCDWCLTRIHYTSTQFWNCVFPDLYDPVRRYEHLIIIEGLCRRRANVKVKRMYSSKWVAMKILPKPVVALFLWQGSWVTIPASTLHPCRYFTCALYGIRHEQLSSGFRTQLVMYNLHWSRTGDSHIVRRAPAPFIFRFRQQKR